MRYVILACTTILVVVMTVLLATVAMRPPLSANGAGALFLAWIASLELWTVSLAFCMARKA